MTATPAQLRASGGSSAETVILELCRVLLGGKGSPLGKSDKGLLRRTINGVRHLDMCQIGMWIEAGDGQRGGQPCSDRCRRAREAASRGGAWLQAHEVEAPAGLIQVDLFEEAV